MLIIVTIIITINNNNNNNNYNNLGGPVSIADVYHWLPWVKGYKVNYR